MLQKYTDNLNSQKLVSQLQHWSEQDHCGAAGAAPPCIGTHGIEPLPATTATLLEYSASLQAAQT